MKTKWQQNMYIAGLAVAFMAAMAPVGWAQTPVQSGMAKAQPALAVKPVSLPTTIEEQHDYAIKLARDNDFVQALPILKRAAQIVPHPKYVSDYLVVSRWAGLDAQALDIYHQWTAAHTEPLTSYALKTLGDIYFGNGDKEKAYQFYAQAASMGDETAQLALVQKDATQGQYDKAMPFYDKKVAADPANYQVYLDRANAYISGGAYMSAHRDFVKARSLVPAGDAKALQMVDQNRAMGFIRAGEYAEGRDVLYPYIRKGTATMNMQCDYMLALQGMASYSRAVTEGEALWPDKSKVPAYGLRALADCYIRLKNYDKAIAYHTELINRAGTEPKFRSYLSRGYTYMITDRIKPGLADYTAAIQERPASRFLVCEDAKHFFSIGRYELGKELFRRLVTFDTMVQTKEQAAGGSDLSVYRQQFAYDLLTYDMPRESYKEYTKLAEQTRFKETAYAGMAQAALRYGDYRAAKSALQKLSQYDTGSKEAEQARKAWQDRWHGTLTASTSWFKNYQDKDYRDFSVQMENELTGSWHLLSAWGFNKKNQNDADSTEQGFNLGLRYIGRDFDARAWALTNVPSGSGYSYDLTYFFRDFTWLEYSEGRTGVDNPAGYNRDITHRERRLNFHRQIGPKDIFEIGYLWDRYSDGNHARGFDWQYRHMSYQKMYREVEWYLFQRHYAWDRESDYYDSPSSRVAYGPGLRLWWGMPRHGYWELITEASFGYDAPDNTDFTPFIRLERGWELAPGRTLVAGFEYGWRSDRSNDTKRLNKGYHQFDLRYNWNW